MIKYLVTICLMLLLYTNSALAMPPIMTTSELKPGMQGYAETVVQGAQQVSFNVEIIGVVNNGKGSSKQILARAYGPIIEETNGVIHGMSGSPVYVDGKLIGAVARAVGQDVLPYKFYITPIEEMLKIWTLPDSLAVINKSNIEKVKIPSLEEYEKNQDNYDENIDKEVEKYKSKHLATPEGQEAVKGKAQKRLEEEIKKVEDIVNEKIAEAIPVETKIMTIEEAKNTGAMALFGEKYGEKVRVVCMGDFSKEFCGGTHVANTANIRLFKIVSESGVAAGVRRIEALTDKGVLKFFNNLETLVKEASIAAKAESTQLVRRIHTMNDEIKALISENDKLKAELANNALGDVTDNVVDVKGVKLLATKVDNVDMNELRNLGDKLKGEIGSGVVLVVSALAADKVNMIAMATDDVVAKGAHAGNLIKSVASLVGGGGGGRPNMAQAGGKNASGIDELLKKAPEVLAEQL